MVLTHALVLLSLVAGAPDEDSTVGPAEAMEDEDATLADAARRNFHAWGTCVCPFDPNFYWGDGYGIDCFEAHAGARLDCDCPQGGVGTYSPVGCVQIE